MDCILLIIIISPINDQFIFNDDKLLLGKTDPKDDEFDMILFASCEINKNYIPSNIKVISTYAFEFCINWREVEILI